ncbi:MAG: right-handed parallel beta-helix repeat-containing protein [Armatimonadetes bacterium]|nr:right-handed parallel beta-helix repeat-containing protein [Armatimonadota bacterium]
MCPLLPLTLLAATPNLFPDPPGGTASITVGQAEGDLRGSDQRAIQGAIEYVAGLGGGTVYLLPGVYTLSDSVHLRSHVNLVGRGEGVVLRQEDGWQVPLTTDGDYGEAQVSVAEPGRWRVGMGIAVADDANGGFLTTVTTVAGIDGHGLRLTRRIHGGDLLMTRHAWAAHAFPPIAGSEVEDVRIENVTVEGNKARTPALNGCVGGGIYTFRSRDVRIVGCTVRDYHGDGISFQTSFDVTVERCEVSGCTNLGLHPGSGSQRPRIRECFSHHNDDIGLFVCWRVRGGEFAGNRIEDNGGQGISIGHKDTDNLFEHNRILRNGQHGVLFRNEPVELAAHRNTLRDNVIEDNGTRTDGGCGIRVEGATQDLVFERNTIRCTAGGKQRTGIWIGPQAERIRTEANVFEGDVESEVKRAAPGG